METTTSEPPARDPADDRDLKVVRDVTASDFEQIVVQRSSQVPVLVDFWAPWCGPCRTLGPILEKLAVEMGGAFELAKVNSDQDPELSLRFGVQGIPAVKLFRDGEIVDEFVGALPERQVRAFLQRWCPTQADRLAAEGRDLLAAGSGDEARRRFETALALDSLHAAALLGLARVELAEGRLEAAAQRVEQIPVGADEHEAAQALAEVLDLARSAAAIGDPAACEERLAANPDDVEACWALGAHAVTSGDFRGALERFLRAVEIDRRWNGEAARKAMLSVFSLVGAREPLAEEFRDRLRRLLY